jgi:hypothetical protein
MKTFVESEAERQVVVERLVALAPRGWKRIFVDYEIQDRPDTIMCSEVAFAVVKKLFGKLERIDLNLGKDLEIGNALRQLAKPLFAAHSVPHVTFDIIVRESRSHDWHFHFDPPPRLSAILRGDLMAPIRDPSIRKPYKKFTDSDELLGTIP